MSDNMKEYYNRKLDRILKRYITPRRYGEFCGVIKDIFQRRAYEYEFSEAEMKEQVKNFIANVEKVELAPEEILEGNEGTYKPGEHAIYINQDYLLELENSGKSQLEIGEDILETLTHEVYHGIVDKDDDVGLAHYNYKTDEYSGNALDEIFTEVAADRASKSRGYKEAQMYRSETTGYSEITFVVNLLAASLGTTEKELLKVGITDRDSLMKLFRSKFSSYDNSKFAETQMFNRLESSLDVVYNCIYDSNEVDPITNSQILTSSLTSLYASAYDMALFQIENNMQEVTPEYVSSVSYRYSKIEKIMNDSLSDFRSSGYINDEQVEYINYMEHVLKGTMAKKVLELQGIDNPAIDVITAAQKVSAHTQDMSHYSVVMQEDFDNGKQWDNEAVSSGLYSIYDRTIPKELRISNQTEGNMQFADTDVMPVVTDDMRYVETDVMPVVTEDMQNEPNGFFSKIKDTVGAFFTRLKNSRIAKLNPPREERYGDNSEYYANLATAFSKKYEVKQEELKPMKSVLKESKREKDSKDNERI